jgi:long-chain acyl-CoA synthetase
MINNSDINKTTITRNQAIEQLCAPGGIYELNSTQINGRNVKVFKNAPKTLSELYFSNHSELDFIVYQDERYTFAAILKLSTQLANIMSLTFNIKKGDRVGISMRNYPEWSIAFIAATSIGAIAVSLNALWGPKDLKFAINDSEPKLLIVDQERLINLSNVITNKNDTKIIRVRAKENENLYSYCWEDLLTNYPNFDALESNVMADDDATIIYTSGTTGFPKGVISTHRNIIHALLSWELEAEIRNLRYELDKQELPYQEAMLLAVPLFHVSGSHVVLLASFRNQRKMVCMYKWDAEEGLKLVQKEKITGFTAAPAITGDLVNAYNESSHDISSLLILGGGGAHRAPEQVKEIDSLNDIIMPQIGWGMTETNAIGTSAVGDAYADRPSTCGECSAVLEMRIVSESGAVMASGEIGELQVRGTSMFRGYWNKSNDQLDCFDGDWFKTGDVAKINPDGFIYIMDRIKDLIIRGGENISCSSVEYALMEHPEIIEACVYSLPDIRLGELVAASIYTKSKLNERSIKSFLKGKLANFEIPEAIKISSVPLARGASGKITKRLVQQAALEAS